MDLLAWLLFESTLALGGLLAVVLFVLLVHWRRTLRPRPLLVGLVLAVGLLTLQTLVVTRRERADRIMRRVEAGVLASRPAQIAAVLSDHFHVADPEMDRDAFLDLVRRYLQRVDVRTITRRALEIEPGERQAPDRFAISVSYLANVTGRDFGGTVLSRWRIVFVRDPDGWRIATAEPRMINRRTLHGWRGLHRP